MRIACLLGESFDDAEFVQPHRAFQDAGHEVVVIGTQAGTELHGYRGTANARTETSIDEVDQDQFDALFVPGGFSPDHLRLDPSVVAFTRCFIDSGKPCFVICHGPQLLMAADAVSGRRMTAWPTVRRDLHMVGDVDVVNESVVTDRNLVTSRMPDDLPAFIDASLRKLGAKID